tara:strand:- start:159 stop:395 length:237 start_codon:yes stop_codon:yes gene_type:complete
VDFHYRVARQQLIGYSAYHRFFIHPYTALWDIVCDWRESAAYSSSEDYSGLRLATHMRSVAVGAYDCGSFHDTIVVLV